MACAESMREPHISACAMPEHYLFNIFSPQGHGVPEENPLTCGSAFVERGVGVVVAPVEPVVLESGDAVETFALGWP